jgi:hypothetical protein
MQGFFYVLACFVWNVVNNILELLIPKIGMDKTSTYKLLWKY